MESPDNNRLTCPFCGGEIVLHGNSMANEAFDGYDGDDVALVYYMKYRRCGKDYEVLDPPVEERENDYKNFWNPN